ncbi:MAG: thioesterase family protein [Anaerolineaceae bacterium]|nr:thioesterase family protein [Anaerolineae bacterium]MCB9451505.1 thioesterase family protein [Anaerolineaceae bacterium]
MSITPGIKGEKTRIVTADLTAKHMGSGGLDVYATPAMIALMEGAAVTALESSLSAGQSSVGIALDVKHLAATPLGLTVRAEAEVTAVDGKRVTFAVRAWDNHELIGEGTHIRYIIDVARFMERVSAKSG